MLELEFTATGYAYMALIWLAVGAGGVLLARRHGRNPLLWGVACLIAPVALFYLAGIHSGREDAARKAAREAAAGTGTTGSPDNS